MSEFHHVSVLLQECLDSLDIKPEGIYVDGTLGGGGHAAAAGCSIPGTLEDGKEAILRVLREEKVI